MANLQNISNFADLLKVTGVRIPMLQRDYVQGRIHSTAPYEKKGDEYSLKMLSKYKEEKEKRDSFVRQLIKALIDPTQYPIELTFIYGVSETSSNCNSELHHSDSFVPLDGQQRLTTLFLLMWSVINKIPAIDWHFMEKTVNYDLLKKGLKSFSYMTRPSSDLFCGHLSTESLLNVKSELVSRKIEAQPWFDDEWKLDPSVSAMLQMIDAIDYILDEELERLSLVGKSKQLQLMLDNLCNGKGITFDLLDMNQYKLSDSLYIKMNARGKQLTKFENWKSEFIELLKAKHGSVKYTNVPQNILAPVFKNTTPTLSEYFVYSIEHQWTDMLWPYSVELIQNKEEEYPVIDDYFMRIFNMVHQVMYYVNNPDKKDANDFTPDSKQQRETTFSDVENVNTLFGILDLVKDLLDNKAFDYLFYVSSTNPTAVNCDDRVRLFDGKNPNLIKRCIKNEDFSAIAQTLLYAILIYAKEFGPAVDQDMKSFARSIRNALESKCYVGTKQVNLVPDYGINDISSKTLVQLIHDLIEDKKQNNLLKISKEHATIDDFDFTNGNLCGDLLPERGRTSPALPLIDTLNFLIAWDELTDYERICLLLLYGYTGEKIVSCALGDTYFFGDSEANRWKVIFTTKNNNLHFALRAAIQDYNQQKTSSLNGKNLLIQLISQKKNSIAGYNFLYYAVNYFSFMTTKLYMAISGSRDEMNIECVRYSRRPASGYHTDPMSLAVKEELKKLPVAAKTLYLTAFGKDGDKGSLCVYDTPHWDGKEAIACLTQVCGSHGNGGWTLSNNGITINYPDTPNYDRVKAGVDIIKNQFPNCCFLNKE